MCRFATHRPVCTPIFTSPNIVSGCLFAPPRKPARLPPHLPDYPAPAKLNLDLRIIRQRPDGYHDIESLFTLINLTDTLAIAPRPGIA